MNKSLKFQDHFLRYHNLIMSAQLRENYFSKANYIANMYLANVKQYKYVSDQTGVPAPLIGALHNKEASMRFNCCLHNGQPLDKVTTIVPKGRGPFKTWEASAIDALQMKKKLIDSLNITSDAWSMEQCLWFAESYNGWGYYLYRDINSPYLWCGTTNYTKGGYPSDGKFDINHVVKNVGVYPVLNALYSIGQLDLSIDHMGIHNLEVNLTDEELALNKED